MGRDLFARLPPETTVDILSRLSVRSIALSKCVCKPWLGLLRSDDFPNSHFSKSSAAALAVSELKQDANFCEIFELEDEVVDLEKRNPIFEFDFPREATFEDSADGLLFLLNFNHDTVYACNPITREIIELSFPHESVELDEECDENLAYGFGVSKVSRQHKVVRVDSDCGCCHVYTLGTGQWRRLEAATPADSFRPGRAFANGNVYWIISDPKDNDNEWISCFDLETERFSTVSSPPGISYGDLELCTFGDCLCSVDSSSGDKILIWLLKERGVEKSWRVEYTIDRYQRPDVGLFSFRQVLPIKVLKNGDILMFCGWSTFFCYSIETKTYREICSIAPLGGRRCLIKSLLFTPSFRSLQSFGMENVISF